MKIALYSRFLKPEHIDLCQTLLDALEHRGWTYAIWEEYHQSFQGQLRLKAKVDCFHDHLSLKQFKPDLFITLGGDGTILDAVTLIRNEELPIMGINLGRLGFLAMIEKHRIEEALQAFEQNALSLEPRALLQLESSEPLFGETPFALNDFTIAKRDTSSMVIIHTYVNGAFLNSYWADGIIVATPTGSTGYSLSCGGPIIFPKSASFIITPVAPHNLNVRPIVLSDDVVISFEIEGRARNFLCTLDSRYRSIQASCQLAVRRAPFMAQLLRFNDLGFLNMIQKKLNWGLDSRN